MRVFMFLVAASMFAACASESSTTTTSASRPSESSYVTGSNIPRRDPRSSSSNVQTVDHINAPVTGGATPVPGH